MAGSAYRLFVACPLNGLRRTSDTGVMPEQHIPKHAPVSHRDRPNISVPSADIQETIAEVRSLDPVARLVERAKDGDKDAFGQIYRLHRDAIYRFASTHLRGQADDVVAEVFIRAWVHLPRYKFGGTPFVAWLYGIARHVVADEIGRQARTEPRADLPESISEWGHDDRLVLAEAISELPHDQRKVIEMKFLLGMRNPEIAASMNTTTNAVNAKQWRALANLRDELGQDA